MLLYWSMACGLLCRKSNKVIMLIISASTAFRDIPEDNMGVSASGVKTRLQNWTLNDLSGSSSVFKIVFKCFRLEHSLTDVWLGPGLLKHSQLNADSFGQIHTEGKGKVLVPAVHTPMGCVIRGLMIRRASVRPHSSPASGEACWGAQWETYQRD